jgi:hypothetical protein
MHQLESGDELIVVVDGLHKLLGEIEERLTPLKHLFRLRVLCTYAETMKHNGAEQRDCGIKAAWGTNLMFLDDDDIYMRGALAGVRSAVGSARGLPHIFKMQQGMNTNFRGDLWRTERIELGNVGTPMFVIPNTPDLPKWGSYDSGGHDYEFIRDVVTSIYAGHVVWCPQSIAIVRPTEAQISSEIP